MLVSLSGVSIAFQGEPILAGVDFRIDRQERVALVGRNGTGKSTLLKLITGELAPDAGSISIANGAKIGYLQQMTPVNESHSVKEEVQTAKAAHLEMKRRLERLELRAAEGSLDGEGAEELALLQERYREAEGYLAEQQIELVLKRMGFGEADFDRSVGQLSGGEKTRLALARLLLEEPDLLILDEPTNHLDLAALDYLENWLQNFRGSVLTVSHDRQFLDAVAQRVLSLEGGTITAYPGPFPKFLQLREEARARQAILAKKQEQEIAKLDEYVRRFMNSQRTSQARGRLKMMNRLITNKLDAPKNERGMKGTLKASQRSGQVVIEAKKLAIGFPDLTLAKDISWTVQSGERWGVIGENGAGKSTLLKTILGKIEPVAGSAKLGAAVNCGYFSQDAAEFDESESALDVLVWENDLSPADARNVLGRFLITGDDVYRPIRTLSGGERNKLSLAQLTVVRPNLLILDEPTNHLDMDSREALAEILREYDGTLVLISHDRWLLDQVCNRILEISPEGARLYPGGFADFWRKRQAGSLAQETANRAGAASKKSGGSHHPGSNKPGTTPPESPENESGPANLSPRELSKEIQRVQKLTEAAELRVTTLETTLAEIEAELERADPSADVLALSLEHGRVAEQIEGALSAWQESATLHERLQALQMAGATVGTAP